MNSRAIATEMPRPDRRPRGRPRSFDRAAALEAAMRAFWRLGYEGASIADLTQAMGITAPALYTAFKSKLALYKEALALYRTTQGRAMAALLAEGCTAKAAIAGALEATARACADRHHPPGCMISTAVVTCATENRPAARHTAALRAEAIAAFQARIERGIAEGDLPPDTDAAALARYCGAIVQGLSIQAQDGAGAAELLAVVKIAVERIPGRAA